MLLKIKRRFHNGKAKMSEMRKNMARMGSVGYLPGLWRQVGKG